MAMSNNPSQSMPHTESPGSRIAGEAREKVQDLSDKARSAASNVADKARSAASNVADKARSTAADLGDKADDALSSVGQTMTSLAGQLREKAPHEGMIGNAASTVADNLQAGGRYLQEHHMGDIGEEATQIIRRHPVPSLFFAFGIGCLLGLSLSRR
jgi:ElaB/YqjD/DUF883 family membrane-anchored ribosome-binding protein